MVTGILDLFSLLSAMLQNNLNNFYYEHGGQNENAGKEIFSLKMWSFYYHVKDSAEYTK